ncbi:MAG TPA: hypothetical protein VFI61_04655 [Patescibacteria group bacterium]|nr:hypothetical protein [Patescibacteria group bacterium]
MTEHLLQELHERIKQEHLDGNFTNTDYGHALKTVGSNARDAEGEDKLAVIQSLIVVYKQFGDSILKHLPVSARKLLKDENIID